MWLIKVREVIRWLLVLLSGAFGIYAIASIHWDDVWSHPTDSIERHLVPSLCVSLPFLLFSYCLVRQQYRWLSILACIMSGLCMPWLTCLIFRYQSTEMMRMEFYPEPYQVTRSGFPLPFMRSTDRSMNIDIQWPLYWADAICWALALWFSGCYFLRLARSRRQKLRGTH
jgi:hypothetical protein